MVKLSDAQLRVALADNCFFCEEDRFEPFAVVSNPAILSERVIREIGRIYVVAPDKDSVRLDSPGLRDGFRVSLLTSVYNGDVHLVAFLDDISRATLYSRCEHFLIRAGSSGGEHATLVQYVLSQPNAIYLNFPEDPGLYEVWNLAVRLSSAPYLSNANLDDRRSPEHIERMVEVLDDNPDIDVVSSVLRVSDRPDIAWEESGSCPLMFEGVKSGPYGVGALMQYRGGAVRSRNLPHCMPVWRRRLHAFHGYFDEHNYGPSADWEFWLRVGNGGARFYFVDEPLGLYLKSPNSYWHRNSSYDNAIIEEYAPLVMEGQRSVEGGGNVREPVSLQLNRALRAFALSDYLAGAVGLFSCIEALQEGSKKTLMPLISKAGRMHLGRPDIMETFPDERHISSSIERFAAQFTGIIHGIKADDLSPKEASGAKACLLAICRSLELPTSVKSLLLSAFVSRKLGDNASETLFLKEAHGINRLRFWEEWQSVYRFSLPTSEMSAIVSDISPSDTAGQEHAEEPDYIFYYPPYSGNEYQRLLYRGMEKRGTLVEAIRDFRQIRDIKPPSGGNNIIHVHWINAVLKCADIDSGASARREFIHILRHAKRAGFSVYWTIHNRLSHEVTHIDEEIALRRELYGISDRVYVHHPMAADLLEWLPSRDKLYLLEHGNYESFFAEVPDKDASRAMLGIDKNDFVLVYVGQVRDYKGIDQALPVVLKALEDSPNARLFLLGKIKSEVVRQFMKGVPCGRVTVRDEYVSGKELELYMRAADFGFLSYKDVLTSGSLFHWASYGIPVIAPRLGTIPAYVVPGWNGFLYQNDVELNQVLTASMKLPDLKRQKLRQNMLTMAGSLTWKGL